MDLRRRWPDNCLSACSENRHANVDAARNIRGRLGRLARRDGIGFRKADNASLAVGNVGALQAAAHRLSAAIWQRRCRYWMPQLVLVFSPAERAALAPGYRFSMAQMELASDIIFKRSAPLKALFQRARELGVLAGGADRTAHLFGRRIDRRYEGKLQTVLDQREGSPSAALVRRDVICQELHPW